MLIKTPYSYCSREDADFAGLDYSASDFSVELAVDIPIGAFAGAFGELIRHGAAGCVKQVAYPGWGLHCATYGFDVVGGFNIYATVIGGSQSAQAVGTTISGTNHIVMTFKRSTGTVTLYVNGVSVASNANATIAMPATPGGTLTIGGSNNTSCSTTPSVGGLAMPEFNMWFARMFNGELTSTNVADLYARWNGTNRTDLPAGITPSVVSFWSMMNEVSDKNGTAGTGWIKDDTGGNHLKICDTGAIVGGTQASIVAPSGSVSIASPANAATGVSGAAVIRATGLYGSNNYLQYYIELDEANTFNTAGLRNSGWLNHDGRWQPRLKPSTTYYLRTKAREGNNTGVESSWSSTVSFTTRAVTTYYARPRTTAGTYGNEDGSSYANAFNGMRHNGTSSGLQANLLKAQCDARNLAPGDTVYVCDNWGLLTGSSTTLSASTPERQFFTGYGLSGYPILVRLDHGTYPGAIYHCYKYTGAISWTSEGAGVYSSTTYVPNANWIGVDDGTGKPTTGGSGTSQTILLNDNTLPPASPGFYYANSKIYVKTEAGTSPGNDLWYFIGNVETFCLLAMGGQYVTFQGGAWYGTSPSPKSTPYPSTFVTIKDALFKYAIDEACFYIANDVDDWTFDNVEIAYAANGIYGWNTPFGYTGRTGDRATVTNCWIHDIGVDGWYNDDSHCVGWQAGEAWIVEDCLLERSGSAVTQWGSDGKYSRNNIIRRNVIKDIRNKSNTFGAGISFENGAVTPGYRTGNQIVDNVIYDTAGPGIHFSVADAVTITGNLLINLGTDVTIDSDLWNGINLKSISASYPAKATITGNIVVDPRSRFVRIGGNGTITDLTINDNLYFATSGSAGEANRFQSEGYLSGAPQSFTSWKAGGTFDQASSYGDPLVSSLPTGFDSAKIDFFLGNVVGDMDDDGDAATSDLTALQALAGGPRVAMERWLSIYGETDSTPPAPGPSVPPTKRAGTIFKFMFRGK